MESLQDLSNFYKGPNLAKIIYSLIKNNSISKKDGFNFILNYSRQHNLP